MADDQDVSSLRRIVPLDIEGLSFGSPLTLPPVLDWIEPTKLLVDDAYQRSVSVKGQKLIKKILTDFDWRRFKPPTVVETKEGYEVLDGQHSAIAAASHPDVEKIPVLIVDAAERPQRASTFIGINRDRLTVNPMQLHNASVVSGLPMAMEIETACRHAKITILRSARQAKDYKPGDTIAIRAIEGLIKRRGIDDATSLLTALSDAELTPISAASIKAAEFLMFNPDNGEDLDGADLTAAIQAAGQQAERDASVFSAEHDLPHWRGLASIWLRKARRKKPKAESHDRHAKGRSQANGENMGGIAEAGE